MGCAAKAQERQAMRPHKVLKQIQRRADYLVDRVEMLGPDKAALAHSLRAELVATQYAIAAIEWIEEQRALAIVEDAIDGK
jgi:hypothetical protein